MLQTPRGPVTRLIRLSSLFADPAIRDAFTRAERDHGNAFAVPPRQLVIAADRGSTQSRKDALVRSPLRHRFDLPMAIVVLAFATSILALVLLPAVLPANQ